MTPKEKALDLVEQFAVVLTHDEFYEDSIMCARIAVELLLQEFYVDEFYTEVKQELKKLCDLN